MDPYNRRKAAGGRTITVRLNAEDGALLDSVTSYYRSKEAAIRAGIRLLYDVREDSPTGVPIEGGWL